MDTRRESQKIGLRKTWSLLCDEETSTATCFDSVHLFIVYVVWLLNSEAHIGYYRLTNFLNPGLCYTYDAITRFLVKEIDRYLCYSLPKTIILHLTTINVEIIV